MFIVVCFFFFFKQKTAYEMRISDWSSDVCSSDLVPIAAAIIAAPAKDPGYTPESLIAALKRNIAHPQVAFDRLRSDAPIDGGHLLRKLRHSLDTAAGIAKALPDEAIGKFYIHDARIVDRKSTRLNSSH